MEVGQFFALCNQYPWAYVAIIFDLGVVFMNGWTDVPNCIATCVTTRCMKPKWAILMAALGNLLGTLAAGFLASVLPLGDVSSTVAGIVQFNTLSGITLNQMFIAIAFGLLANVILSLICTYFGFPSSQSNALVGGLTGSAIGLAAIKSSTNWFEAVSLNSWIKVLIGFFGSILVGFILGYGIVWLIVMGGKSIIKTMGSGMAKLHKYQGFATDIAAGIGLIVATVFGLPISSGTIKATAILGVGAQRNPRRVRWGKAGQMVLSWIAIFPGTAIIGFALTALFAAIFK